MPSSKSESEICDYVKKNPGTTENKVATYMDEKGISSRMTTLKIIEDLKKRGIILDRQEGNSFHRLYINDKNEFNRIQNELSEIENIIDDMHGYKQATNEYIENAQFGDSHDAGNAGFLQSYMHIYEPPIRTMLQILLSRTNNIIHSEKDRQVLYAKFIELIAKVDNEDFDVNWKKILDAHGKDINKFLSHKDDGQLHAEYYTLATDLREIMENFKKQFL